MHLSCNSIVIIPTVVSDYAPRSAIRSRWPHICVYFFAGVLSLPRSTLNVSLVSNNVSHPDIVDYVLLPVVDAYHNMGNKLVHMVRWVAMLQPQVVLYLDTDFAQRTSERQLSAMFAHTSKYLDQTAFVGDEMDCLFAANQVCCCGHHHALSMIDFYGLAGPYTQIPSVMWGGGGIGLTGRAVAHMLQIPPTRTHYNSDHTLSLWARSINATMYQAPWSRNHFTWCSNTNSMRVHRLSLDAWKCKAHDKLTHSFAALLARRDV